MALDALAVVAQSAYMIDWKIPKHEPPDDLVKMDLLLVLILAVSMAAVGAARYFDWL